MSLVEVITTGMNNPECSFFVGTMFGQLVMLRVILGLVVAFFIFKVVDKLAFEPLLSWIKNKIYGVKR